MLMLAAILLFAIEGTVIRWLANDIVAVQAVLFRSIGQFVVVFGWAAMRGTWPDLRSKRIGMHCARGFTSIVSWYTYYLTFQKLPVALATLLTYAGSLFVVVFAGPVLGERVKRVSWIATLVGFVGIAIACDVMSARIDLYVWLGLFSAALSAIMVFLTRALAQSEDTVTIMAWIGVFVLPASIIAAFFGWQPLSTANTLILLVSGTVGAIGMVLMIEAYAVAEAAVLAPIPYVRMGFALLMGLLLFNEIPTVPMLVGTMIVIGAALYALRAERV